MDRRLVLVLAAACGGSSSADRLDAVAAPDTPTVERFQRCVGRGFVAAPDEGWRHSIATPLVTALGAPNHSGADIVANPGAAVTVPGKFSYGPASKDLEDEDVVVSIDDCTGWTSLGRKATNSDGRITVTAPALPTGVYEIKFQVAGDQSLTTSYLWVLPAGTHVVVSDVDATLTTNDSEVFRQILDGSYIPMTYPNAVELTAAHERRGHIVIYLTGRPYWLSDRTRGYLEARDVSLGPLRLADSNSDILPTEGSVGAYKRAKLAAFLDAGLVIDFAYGNATTDISSYLGAGIAADRVWIIGPHAGEQGTHAIAGDWAARVAEVDALPTVVQPFEW
jgi:phosphatidate phosphatase PAH1